MSDNDNFSSSVVRERGVTVAPPTGQAGEPWQRVPIVAGTIVAGVGLMVLFGWTFGLDAFKSVLPGLATMKSNTALCFLLAGVALALRERGAVRMACAGLVCTVAGLTLTEYVTDADFGMDQLLFRDTRDMHTIFPGRMAEATALGFMLSAGSLLLLGTKSRSGGRAQQGLAVAAAVIGMVAILGYAYNVQQLYRFAGYSSMALHTALSFVLLAAGLVFARTDGLARVLTMPGPAAQLARRLLPTTLLTPAVLGWLVDRALEHDFFGEGMDIAMLTLAMMLSLAALVWWTAHALLRADATRRETETQLRNQAEVMDHARDALIMCEMDGSIRSWNRGAEKLYGWSAVEAIGQNTHTLLRTPVDAVQEFNAALEQNGNWEGELTHTTRDGRRITVETRKTATRTEDGRELILESNRDITERKKAEEELERERKQLWAIIESLDEAVGVWNTDGSLVLINDATAKLYGFEMKEQMLKHLSDYADVQVRTMDGCELPPEEWPPSRVLRGETFSNWELEQYIPSINKRFIGSNSGVPIRDANGKIILGVTSVRDITERKRAEAALGEHRELLEAVINSLPMQVNLMRGSDLRLQFVNPAYQALAPGKEMVGRTLGEVWPETGQDFAVLCRRVLETGETYHVEDQLNRIRRQPDGPLEERYFSWSLLRVRLPGENGWGILNPAWDTTARHQAEEALAAAHQQTQSLIDNTTALVYACDLEERFVLANAALAALLRTTPEQLLGKRRHEFMPQADADAHEAADRKVIAAGRAVEFEEHSDLHGRSITWLSTKFPLRDVQGRIYGVAGIVTDISERKQAEEAVQRSEALLKAVLDNIPEAIYLKDLDSRLLMANPATFAVIGKPAEAVIGKTDAEFYDNPATGRAIIENDRRIMASGRMEVVEERVFDPAGTRTYLSSKAPYHDGQGRIIGLIGSARDITARKRAEEALRASNQELEEFNKAMVGRELRMIELKQEINEVCAKAGLPLRYPLDEEEKLP